MPKDVQNNRNM